MWRRLYIVDVFVCTVHPGMPMQRMVSPSRMPGPPMNAGPIPGEFAVSILCCTRSIGRYALIRINQFVF